MSYIHWHTADGHAALGGPERPWLRDLARASARTAWAINPMHPGSLERGNRIMDLIPGGGPDYLQDARDEANQSRKDARSVYEQMVTDLRLRGIAAPESEAARAVDYGPSITAARRFLTDLATALSLGDSIQLAKDDVTYRPADLEMNTALAAGSDPVRLAAKIDSWCEAHCWVDGPDRAWMAGLIETGLDQGLYRHGLRIRKADDRPAAWRALGWTDVVDLLRASDQGEVVLSYSHGDDFPNEQIAEWEPPPAPPGWRPYWANDADGIAEWEALPAAEQESTRQSAMRRSWYKLPLDEQWATAMAGLRTQRPWAQITPTNLAEQAFGPPMNIYQLLADDRTDQKETR